MDTIIINTADIQITQGEFFIRLLVAIGIGFLIGLEREHDALIKNERSFAGIRTFVFVSILGFMGAMMHYLFSPWIYVGILVSLVALIGFSYWITASSGDIGSTTEFTAIIVFFLAGMAFLGFIEVSLMITVVVVVLLSMKLKLQEAIGKITPDELYDLIRFIVVALLIFPFLPDEYYGPYEVINPREIGWVILLTSGLGLVGYVMMKFIGADRGILVSGIIGGLVSSTATTWVFAKKSKESPGLSMSCAIAILAASSIMVIRVLVWVAIFNSSLLSSLYIPLGIIFIGAIGASVYFYVKSRKDTRVEADVPKGKSLDLQSALVFGVIYAVITLVVSYANDRFGQSGLLVSSAIAGLSDIDAITISVSKLAGNAVGEDIALNAILIATLSNTLVKMGIGFWAGSSELKKHLLLGYGSIFVAGVIGFVILNI